MKKTWKNLVLHSTGIAATLVITLTSMILMVVLGIVMLVIKIMTFIR